MAWASVRLAMAASQFLAPIASCAALSGLIILGPIFCCAVAFLGASAAIAVAGVNSPVATVVTPAAASAAARTRFAFFMFVLMRREGGAQFDILSRLRLRRTR
jgi:hypothetical protein